MGQGAKTQKAIKAGRTIVEVVPAAGTQAAWWTEKDSDLVYVSIAEDVDAVLAAIDGQSPGSTDSPQRATLYESEETFTPIGGLLVDFDKLKLVNAEARRGLQDSPLRRLDYRWGFDGPALMDVLRMDLPAPRTGAWALLDQPSFDFRALPPIPADAERFTAVSFELDKAYDQVTSLVRRSNPEAGGKIDEFEKLVQEKTRKQLREDFLAPLGPKMAFYMPPGKPAPARTPAAGSPGAAATNNPLAFLGSIGLQVPKAVFIAEVSDPTRFSRALDELIIFVNKQLETQYASMAAASAAQTKGAAGKAARKPGSPGATAPKFQMTSTGTPGSPKTYVLRLPTQMAAMTNLNLTIMMGQKHLVIATAADVAREALALEGKTEGRWAPRSELAPSLSRLPEGRLILLQVDDPRSTLPEALASLPQTAATISATIAQAAKGGGPADLSALLGPGAAATPGAAPASGAGGGVDDAPASRSSAASGNPLGRGKLGLAGGPPPAGSSAGAAPATAPPGAPPAAPGSVTLDASKAPRAEQIRPLLFPGSAALAVDDRGLRFVTRRAFPDVASSSAPPAPAWPPRCWSRPCRRPTRPRASRPARRGDSGGSWDAAGNSSPRSVGRAQPATSYPTT
jgi:hypothetical protein